MVINFSRPVNRQNGGAGQLERAARRAVKPLSWVDVLTLRDWLAEGPRHAGAANLALQSMLCFSWVAFLADTDITVGHCRENTTFLNKLTRSYLVVKNEKSSLEGFTV